jgi:hypothetical protein
MKRLWHRHPFLIAAFAIALALSLFFAGRIVFRAVYWSQHREVQVQPWMTVGYVGRSWGLDPRQIDAAAGLASLVAGRPSTLEQIAEARGVPADVVVAGVEAAIADLIAAKASEDGP